jgi:hypothetical protein
MIGIVGIDHLYASPRFCSGLAVAAVSEVVSLQTPIRNCCERPGDSYAFTGGTTLWSFDVRCGCL